MPHLLDSVFDDFKNDTTRVENLLNLTKKFRDFGASTPPQSSPSGETASSCVDAHSPWIEAISLHTESKARRTDLPIFSGSLFLYLVGRFEYCIRQIIEVISDEIVLKTSKYEKLPSQMKKMLKQRTLEIAQNPKKFGYDEISSEALLEDFMDNVKGVKAIISIKSEILSITESNMRPQILQDLLKIVCIKEFWRDIGRQANIKLFTVETSDNEASAKSQAILNDIMEDRNQIAHPTMSTQFPDADIVLQRAEFLQIIVLNTVTLGKIFLASYSEAV